jgi:hypothetical protein
MASCSVLPSAILHDVGTPKGLPLAREGMDFAARYPARTFPYQRFAPALTGNDA